MALAGTVPATAAETPAPSLPFLQVDNEGEAPGFVWVSIGADPRVAAVTAEIYAPSGDLADAEPLAVTELMPDAPHANGNTLWRSAAVVNLPARAADYQALIHLRDASGADLPGSPVSRHYIYMPALRITDAMVDRSTLDWFHQSARISGTVLLDTPEDPGPGTPAAGVHVVAFQPGGGTSGIDVHSDAQGHFTGTTTVYDPSVQLQVNAVPGTGVQGPITGLPTALTVKRLATRSTLATRTLNLLEGKSATLSGHAEVLNGTAWQPLSGADADCPDQQQPAVTGAAGQFTCTFTRPGNRTVAVTVHDWQNLWLAPATQNVAIHTVWKTATTLTATLDDRSRLHVTGTLQDTGTRRTWSAGSRVVLEYSANGSTGWRTIRTLTVNPGSSANPTTGTFSTSFTARNDGYWRARFTGNADNQPSGSPVRRAHRYATRITAFNASPEPVRKGRTLTITGRLEKKTSATWTPAGGQTVTLYFTPRGSTHATRVGTARTNSHGVFTAHATAKQDGTWSATWYATSSGYLTGTATPDYVDVN
ncbi:hypothetical protein [Peterkaempfera sp. SMS 1(5)a]|uniref:hypothetical protein n=1 Tax=Peterkaempfera podocarpi TaxID=3232308 RepID=UPI003671D1BB